MRVHIKKILLSLAINLLLFSLLFSLNAEIEEIGLNAATEQANNEIEEMYGFTNYYKIDLLNDEVYKNYKVLVFGVPHGTYNELFKEYRYLGHTRPTNGENIPNYSYPYDSTPTDDFDDMKWIEDPWGDARVIKDSRYKDIKKTKFDDNRVDYLPEFIKGMEIQHSAYFRNDPGIPWEKYMHIVVPPTRYAFGLARLWHVNSDNSLWYIDVALAPEEMIDPQVTVHVSHFEEDGTPLDEYDYTDYIGVDETKTYDITEIYGYIKDGSKVGYNTVPTGEIDVGTSEVDVTVDATITDIYIEFYYIEEEESESGLEPPTMSAVIYADERDSEVFDAVDGIPTTEELYVNVFTDRYIEDSAYADVEGTNTYDVTVTKNYHLTWEENEPIRKTKHHHHTREDGSTYTTTSHYYVDNWVDKSDSVSVSKTYAIDRDYSFWLILHHGSLQKKSYGHTSMFKSR